MPKRKYHTQSSAPIGFSSMPLALDRSADFFRADIHIDMKVERTGRVFCRTQFPHQHSNGKHIELNRRKDDFDIEYSNFRCLEQVSAHDLSTNLLREIAENGYELFSNIFSDEQEIRFCELQDQIAAEELASADVLYGTAHLMKRIYVSAENLNIPWELLYTTRPISDFDQQTTEIDPTRFLGYRFFIQQDFQDRANLEHEMKPFDKDRGVTIFVDRRLPYTFEKEAPAIKEALERIGSNAPVFGPLRSFKPFENYSGQMSGRNGRIFGKALSDVHSDILHFACHSEYKENSVIIRVDNDYHITEDEVKHSFLENDRGAFIFFNSCELAVKYPGYYCNFLQSLSDKKFSGVIATEIKVKDADAFEFAQAVYQEFVSKNVRSIQKAIFRARRKLLHDKGSFVGFTYSFYGNNDLILGEN